jgi:hypothetical protein
MAFSYNSKGGIHMFVLALFLPLLTYGADWFNENESLWLREHCGIYAWAKHHKFNDFSLPELVEKAKEFGVKVIRVPVDAFYGGDEDFPTVLSSPTYKEIFAKFSVIILTMWDWSGRQYDANWTEKVYYDAARYLLEKYKGSGKTIVMGIWESDNWAPLDERGISFFQARQKGIRKAKKEIGENGMKLIEMIEVNKVDLKGGDCVTNVILPKIKPEMVSLSSWAHLDNLTETLDYIATKVGHRNIMIGEFGLERKNCFPEEEVRKFILPRVRELMKWGVRYLILWQMSDWANGFLDCKENEGKRMTCWFPFYRALHSSDDPLCIEDFREMRTDQQGNPLNLLGGKSDEGILLISSQNGALYLNGTHSRWSTSLANLPLRNYKWLLIPSLGKGKVIIADEDGKQCTIDLKEAIDIVELSKKGVDISKPSKLTIKSLGGEPLFVGGIYLSKKLKKFPLKIDSEKIEMVVPVEGDAEIHPPKGIWKVERLELEAYEKMSNATIKGEGKICPVATRLLPGSKIMLSAGGNGYFLLPNVRASKEEDWSAFERENLLWNEEFKIYLPAKKGEECRLTLDLSFPYNIVGGKFWLTGKKSEKGDWWVEVRSYEGRWEKCPTIFYYPGIPEDLCALLPPDFPSLWAPIRDLRANWVIKTGEEENWQWSSCIMSLRVKLYLDTISAPLPEGKVFYFRSQGRGRLRLSLVKLKAGSPSAVTLFL